MDIQKLTVQNVELINQCDDMFIEFLDSEGKYDENYLKRKKTNSFIKDLEDNNNILLVAKEEENVIGFLYGYIEQRKGSKLPVAHLAFLYVDEQHRNKGVATSLIDNFLDQLKNSGIEIVEVKSFVNNVAAKSLYQKYGFDTLWLNYRKKL